MSEKKEKQARKKPENKLIKASKVFGDELQRAIMKYATVLANEGLDEDTVKTTVAMTLEAARNAIKES